MRSVQCLVIALVAAVCFGCSSTKWVHPYKNEDQFTNDYNKCELYFMNAGTTNPGISMGGNNPAMAEQRMARCLKKEGWREVDIN